MIEPYYFVSLHGKSVDMTDERYIEKCEKIAEDYWKQASVKEFDEASPVIADIFAQLGYMERKGSGLGKILDPYKA